ncbi:MAG: hypothetical protein LBQ52_01035, partial [Helicobacteraceae bacterium]|nr:hypothetical protein [Helicobacteraceae bacterium]
AWSRIDPHKKAIADDLLPYKERLKNEAQKGDYLLVQGDFGATYNMARYAFRNGLIAIYATTERNSVEKIVDGKIVTTREFIHVRFREYEE